MGILATGATVAQAQISWDDFCGDFGTPAAPVNPFSADWAQQVIFTELFGATIGLSGTVTYKYCPQTNPDSTWSHEIKGGLGFGIGSLGSVQDDATGNPVDNFLMLTMGMWGSPGGNFSYAVTERRNQDGTSPARTRFGANGIDTTYVGLSDKYMIAETTNDEIRVQLRVDMIGDAARCQWTLRNTNATTAYQVGLSYGAAIAFLSNNVPPGGFAFDSFNTVAGRKPIIKDTIFRRVNPDPNSTVLPEFPMVPTINFGVTQSRAFGLQVVLDPTAPGTGAVDQTPVDVLTVGKAGFLLGGQRANTGTFPGVVLPDTGIPDGPFNSCAFIQVWSPTAVTASTNTNGSVRQIIAYYKSTTGVSDFDRPYNVVIDAPHVIGTDPNNVYAFSPNPATIRVYIDNTRGFTQVQQEVPLNDVKITLSLPSGITSADPGSSGQSTISRFIPLIAPKAVQFVDFQIAVADSVFGVQPYTVKIEPNPGQTKTLTSSINVATQPRLTLAGSVNGTANLVGSPWIYQDTTWSSILDGLQPDIDFQAFAWDPQQQAYVLQTGPQRGKGSFLIVRPDLGNIALQGGPAVPGDLAIGAPLIKLKGGPGGAWNLIANPYHFSIPLGQIVGVSDADPRRSYTFQDLVSQGVISGAIASWDPLTQRYIYSSNLSDPIEPNKGYWIFVPSSSDVTLSFPPVYEPFVPLGTGGIQSVGTDWKLQIVSTNTRTGVSDTNTFLGFSNKNESIRLGRIQKAPIAPTSNAISTTIVAGTKPIDKLSQLITGKKGMSNYDLSVANRAAGPVKLSWPGFGSLPKGVQVRLIEVGTNRTINMRTASNYTFNATANSTKQFRLLVTIP